MKKTNLILIIILCNFSISGQSDTVSAETQIYDFARFLMSNKLYDFAAQEYERLNFMYPGNRQYTKELVTAYRLGNKFELISNKIRILNQTDKHITLDYVLAALKNDLLPSARQTFNEAELINVQELKPVVYKVNFGMMLIEGNLNINTNIDDAYLKKLYTEYKERPYKSPVTAGIFSAIIPGSGRFYTNDYKNGIISLLFIAGTVWQANSRFQKNGVTSTGGWIYAGLGLGFYLGNIYGSIRSAKVINEVTKKKIDEKTKYYITNLMF